MKDEELDELLRPAFDALKHSAASRINEAEELLNTANRVRNDAEPHRTRTDLPMPRLQLRWEVFEDYWQGSWYEHACFYELVIPLGKLDCRNGPGTGALVCELGKTYGNPGGGRKSWEYEQPKDRLPFRDGKHAEWDASTLKLPIYVISPDGTADLVTPETEGAK